MSLFDSIKKNSTLNAAIKEIANARKSEGDKADALFKSAYEGFEFVISNHLTIATALYNWGFGLLHQAKTKSGAEAIATYKEAINKFSFCLTVDPYYLGAAIDGGVAYMDLARLKQVAVNDELYAQAQSCFEQANQIQAGSASFNLACLHSLANNEEACLNALKDAKEHGSLPDKKDILSDPDLANVVNAAWFAEFIESLDKPEPPAPVEEASAEAENAPGEEAVTNTESSNDNSAD